MSAKEWFSAKTLYKHPHIEAGARKVVFEERVVLFQATSFDDAFAQAEAEAEEYCAESGDTLFLEFVDVYHLVDTSIGHQTEIYSLMRVSTRSDKEYLDTFYDTGDERSQISPVNVRLQINADSAKCDWSELG